MRKAGLVVVVMAAILAAAQAADVTVDLSITIPDAYVADVVSTMAWMNDNIYTNVAVVTNGVTNVVQEVVDETPQAQFKRISARQVMRFWGAKLRQFRVMQEQDDVPVTAE